MSQPSKGFDSYIEEMEDDDYQAYFNLEYGYHRATSEGRSKQFTREGRVLRHIRTVTHQLLRDRLDAALATEARALSDAASRGIRAAAWVLAAFYVEATDSLTTAPKVILTLIAAASTMAAVMGLGRWRIARRLPSVWQDAIRQDNHWQADMPLIINEEDTP